MLKQSPSPLFVVCGISIAERIGDGSRLVYATIDCRKGNTFLPVTLDELAKGLVNMHEFYARLVNEAEAREALFGNVFFRRTNEYTYTMEFVDRLSFSAFFSFERQYVLETAKKFNLKLVPLGDIPGGYLAAAQSAIELHSRLASGEAVGGGAPRNVCVDTDICAVLSESKV